MSISRFIAGLPTRLQFGLKEKHRLCFGYPKPTKKTAAEHAAEGALWYLKHLGYFPIKKVKRKK
jgi:hypothetical protein